MSLKTVKMINREVDGDTRLAALLAVHLVSQVLDEASVIANTAYEKEGRPWRYQSVLKNIENDKLCDADDEDTSFEVSKGDSDIVNENKMLHVANVVATSTPEKVTVQETGAKSSTQYISDDSQKIKLESSFIGQGDEDLDLRQSELTKSTSMYINNLFDMSDVERVVICDETETVQSNPEPNEGVFEAITKIMESYVNTALAMTIEQPEQAHYSQSVPGAMQPVRSSSSEPSEFSVLTDAYVEDVNTDIAFYIRDDGAGDIDWNCGASHLVPAVEINELCDDIPEKLVESNDVARYENAYLTMNRDYDQNSEDDGDPILEDPRGMTLQEVELMTANTSDEYLPARNDPEPNISQKMKKLPVVSAVSADTSGSKKSSLVSRCRSQGARLLACIRGWLRRRVPGRRKENQIPIVARGLCPLSPNARRRATSLLDQRLLASLAPIHHSIIWKFDSVNEALVHSSRWKDYTFDLQPDECGE